MWFDYRHGSRHRFFEVTWSCVHIARFVFVHEPKELFTHQVDEVRKAVANARDAYLRGFIHRDVEGGGSGYDNLEARLPGQSVKFHRVELSISALVRSEKAVD